MAASLTAAPSGQGLVFFFQLYKSHRQQVQSYSHLTDEELEAQGGQAPGSKLTQLRNRGPGSKPGNVPSKYTPSAIFFF